MCSPSSGVKIKKTRQNKNKKKTREKFKTYVIFVKCVPPGQESRLKKLVKKKRAKIQILRDICEVCSSSYGVKIKKKLVKTKKARELFKTYVIFVKCVPPGPDSAVLTTSLPL